jgi:hypothetical protein
VNQKIVACSSTELEYKTLTNGTTKLFWMWSLHQELKISLLNISLLWCDNIGATYLSHNTIFHEKIDFHFIIIHENVIRKNMEVQFICFARHIAHVFTNFNISVALPKRRASYWNLTYEHKRGVIVETDQINFSSIMKLEYCTMMLIITYVNLHETFAIIFWLDTL